METMMQFEMAGTAECGCCQMSADMAAESSCSERSKIFTAREMDILQRIREHGERAKELRKSIERMNGYSESLSFEIGALDELERLRAERTLLEASVRIDGGNDIAAGRPDADIECLCLAKIDRKPNYPCPFDVRETPARDLGRPVCRAIVDDDDLPRLDVLADQ